MPRITDLPSASSWSAEDYLAIVDTSGNITQKINLTTAYASASQPGLVSTGAQTFAGAKTFATPSGVTSSTNYADFYFKKGTTVVGAITSQSTSSANRLYFQHKSADSAYSDAYFLPSKSLTDNTDHSYDILTSKNIVDVSIGSKTIPSSGYVSINGSKPSGTVLASWIKTYSTVSPVASFNITSDGNFLFGAGNTTVTGLVVSYLVV